MLNPTFAKMGEMSFEAGASVVVKGLLALFALTALALLMRALFRKRFAKARCELERGTIRSFFLGLFNMVLWLALVKLFWKAEVVAGIAMIGFGYFAVFSVVLCAETIGERVRSLGLGRRDPARSVLTGVPVMVGAALSLFGLPFVFILFCASWGALFRSFFRKSRPSDEDMELVEPGPAYIPVLPPLEEDEDDDDLENSSQRGLNR